MKHNKRLESTEWILGRGGPSEEGTSGRDTNKIKGSALRIAGGQYSAPREWWVLSLEYDNVARAELAGEGDRKWC